MKYDFNEVHNRLGTYCTQWDYIQDRFNKKDLIPFSISDTDFIIPKPITEKIFEVAHHQIYGYTRWNHHDFKSSITGYFERRHHTHIEEDWILYSPTVMYSVSLLIRLLSQPHDKVLTFEPMYDSFYTVIQDNDRQLVAHRLISKDGTFEIDFDLFEKQVQECQLLLLCSPHNPTGRIWTKEEMDQIIKICKKYQVKIISDEIHMDIQLRDRKHIPLLSYIHEYDELYTAASSSKTFNTPGLIGSYLMIPNEEVREKFLMHTRRKDFLNSVSIFGMYATMIGYTQCDDYIDQLNDYIKENMKIVEEFIKEELPDFKFKTPDGTYLAWIDARDVPYTAEEIQDALVNVGGIGIMKGEIYGGPKYLRMNIGCPQSKLKEGLRRFKIAMDALYSKQEVLIKIQLLWAKHTKWLDRNPVKVPVSKRVIAYAIDWAVGGIISGFPAVLFYGGVTGRSDMFSDLYVFPSLGFPTYWSYLAGILCIVVAFVYYIYIPYKKYPGQTLAKHWLKIKIVNNDDYSDVSLKTLIIRQGVGLFLLEGSAIVVTNYLRQMLTLATGFYFDYYLKMIGMVITMISGVFVLGSASQRSIHDYLAKTRVVGEDEKPAKIKEKKNKKNKKKK